MPDDVAKKCKVATPERRWGQTLDQAVAKCVDALVRLEAAQPPPKPIVAVYFLIRAGRVEYVGQTTNLVGRLCVHGESVRHDSCAFIQCERADLDMLEMIYTAALAPPSNTPERVRRCRMAVGDLPELAQAFADELRSGRVSLIPFPVWEDTGDE